MGKFPDEEIPLSYSRRSPVFYRAQTICSSHSQTPYKRVSLLSFLAYFSHPFGILLSCLKLSHQLSTMAKSLNQKYLEYLNKYPLLTKSVTAAVLAVLNESIATTISKDFKIANVLNKKVKHPFSWKLPVFAFFAAAVNAPLSHYAIIWVNKLFKAPLTAKKRIGQILALLLTVSPLLNALFVSFVSVINMKPGVQSLSTDEFKRVLTNVKISLKRSFLSVYKSSVVTTPIVTAISQAYLDPKYWTVFSSVVYFVLGTGQNTFLKLNNKKQAEYLKKREEVEKEVQEESKEVKSMLVPEKLEKTEKTE